MCHTKGLHETPQGNSSGGCACHRRLWVVCGGAWLSLATNTVPAPVVPVAVRPTLYGHQRRAIPTMACDVAGSEWHQTCGYHLSTQRDSLRGGRQHQMWVRARLLGAFPGAWMRGKVRPSALDKQSRSQHQNNPSRSVVAHDVVAVAPPAHRGTTPEAQWFVLCVPRRSEGPCPLPPLSEENARANSKKTAARDPATGRLSNNSPACRVSEANTSRASSHPAQTRPVSEASVSVQRLF